MATSAEQIISELELFFQPVTATNGDAAAILDLLSSVGWPLDRIAGLNQGTLTTTTQDLIAKVNGLATIAASPPDDTLALLAALAEKLTPLFADVVSLKDSLPTGLPADISDLPVDVLGYLTTTYLAARTAPTYHALRILGIVVDPDPQTVQQGGQLYRVRNATYRLKPKQLVDLIAKPADTFTTTYWPAGFNDNGVGAAALALKLWDLAASLGFSFDNLQSIAEDQDSPDVGVQVGPNALKLTFSYPLADEVEGTIGVQLQVGADAGGNPTVTLTPFAEASVSAQFEHWVFTLEGEVDANPFEISDAGFRQTNAAKPPFKADLKVARGDAANQAFLFGAASGTQISIDELSAFLGLALGGGTPDVSFGFDLKPLAFRIALGGADGFLKSILPPGGIGAQTDLGLQWSNKTGVSFRGSVSLTIDLADQIVLGSVTINGLTITLAPEDSTLNLELAATIGAKIGPASGIIDRIGIRLGFSAPDVGGNLGPFNVDLGFKPPNGLGLMIDASVVKGGGYLFIDTDRGEYAGALELAFAVFSLKAIGILTTKRPDGSQGWSLLLMIFAEFPSPIQLSYGFTLSGVGGLIGLHHGCDRPQLEDGMRTGAFDSILFPRDPVGDAPTIISQLRVIFPIRPNALIIGPMLEIGWSSPNIIKIRVGVLIQLDNVFGGGSLSLKQILILGQLEAILPPGTPVEDALLRLLIDFLGYIDLDDKVIGFIARLRDSKVAMLSLTGMFIVRITWGGDRPSFVLAAGGFHPDFKDLPPGLPSPIDRIGAGFTIGPVNIAILGYFAATPASIQTGARIQAEANISGAGISGHFGFDTIFYFQPDFHFQVDASCAFAVDYKGHKLAGVDFHCTFTGPGRWHIVGSAEFSVLFWNVTLPIDQEFGDPPPPPVIAGINVVAALEGNVANQDLWSAQQPAGGASLVTIAPAAAGNDALAHPLSNLVFSQRRIPLQLTMQRFGRAPIVGDDTVDISMVRVGTTAVEINRLPEHFARSAFIEMTKDEQLARPTFEPFPASIEVGSVGYAVSPDIAVPFDFETVYFDVDDRSAPPRRDRIRHGLPFEHLVQQVNHAEVSRSKLRAQTKLTRESAASIHVTEVPLAAATPDTLRAAPAGLTGAAVYSRSLADQAAAKGAVVVEAFELAGT